MREPAGPSNLDLRHHRISFQADQQPPIARGKITRCGVRLVPLRLPGQPRYLHLAADSVPICLPSFESNRQPVIAIARSIPEDRRRLADTRHHYIDVAVIIYVSEGSAAPGLRFVERGP